MAKAQHATYAVPGVRATAVSRHALRLLVMIGMVAGAWLIGALLLTAQAHATESPEAPSGEQTSAGGLLDGVLGTVTDTLRDPVKQLTEPVREVTAPDQETAPAPTPKPRLPVVGGLLPDQPAPQPSEPDPVRILPMPTQPEQPTDESMSILPLRNAATGPAAVSIPPTLPAASQTASSVAAVATKQIQYRVSKPVTSADRQLSPASRAAALIPAPTTPLPSPEQTPNREQSPASPAPPAPSAKINQAQGGNGNEREQFAVLPRSGGHNVTVGVAGEHNEQVHRGPAAPGLPAISPD